MRVIIKKIVTIEKDIESEELTKVGDFIAKDGVFLNQKLTFDCVKNIQVLQDKIKLERVELLSIDEPLREITEEIDNKRVCSIEILPDFLKKGLSE